MPSRKNPIDQVKGAAIEALRNPKGAAEKAVGTARGTAAIGRMVAGQVGRTAVARAGELAGDVLSRASGRRGGSSSTPTPSPAPVPDPDAPAAASAARTGIADKTATVPSTRVPVEDSTGPAPDEKAPAKKAAAKKAPAKKAAATKAPAKKTPAKKAAAKKATSSDIPTPAEVAENIAPAKKAPAKKTAKKTTKKTTANKSAPGDRLPAKKTAKKSAAADIGSSLPRTAADVRDGDDVDVTTPVGTSAAGAGSNPDTAEHDLQQPGTPPLLDPGTVHAVQSEAETLQKAADLDKGPDKSPDNG